MELPLKLDERRFQARASNRSSRTPRPSDPQAFDRRSERSPEGLGASRLPLEARGPSSSFVGGERGGARGEEREEGGVLLPLLRVRLPLLLPLQQQVSTNTTNTATTTNTSTSTTTTTTSTTTTTKVLLLLRTDRSSEPWCCELVTSPLAACSLGVNSFLRYRSLFYLVSLGLLGGPRGALLDCLGALLGRRRALLGRLGASWRPWRPLGDSGTATGGSPFFFPRTPLSRPLAAARARGLGLAVELPARLEARRRSASRTLPRPQLG